MAGWRALLIPGFFVLLLGAERAIPLRTRKHPWPRRFAVNMVMTALVFLVGFLLVRNTGLAGAGRARSSGWGLCCMLDLPPWASIPIGFCLMDLTFYYWHRANHVVPVLWRFHNVHHVDPDLDVSTSFRFHFVEIGYSAFFRILQVLVLGVGPLTYVIYETAFTMGTMFHHSNVRLPYRFEYWLNKVFVTPRMHGVHHSAVRTETNSNYSVVFSWWDRLHRSIVLNVRQADVEIGVPAYRRDEDNRLWSLIRMPFAGQRQYWRFEDGQTPTGNQSADKPSRMLA
jgi:sterol desaturase/sphingolipid hydroxylase (fatty acid hydroxylase superfamily)